MKLKSITKYVYDGVEFYSLKEVQDKIHNTIGEEVLDEINKNCDVRHKDLFKMLDILCNPNVREALKKCLFVTVELEDYNGDIVEKNILDLKNLT
jgi:hypothetical protein